MIGTVTLIEICSGAVDCGAMAMDERWGVGISGGSVERGNLTPDREALIYFGSPLGRAEPMPSWSKVRGDAAKGRQEPLGMPHRFKAFHRPFALSGGLMRVLGAVVEIPRLPVGHRPHELAVSNPVAGQFVGHQHARYILQALRLLLWPVRGGTRRTDVIFRRPVATVNLDRRDSERPRYSRPDRVWPWTAGMHTSV